MNRKIDILLTDLRSVVSDLGRNGGLISPSVYDTAQVLRLAPPNADLTPALDWLMAQQRTDGGWGNPAAPLTRDVPTLAAIMALQTYNDSSRAAAARMRASVQAGLAFLQQQSDQWQEPLPEELPVGVELILPMLLRETAATKLALSREPYMALVNLGQRKRRQIQKMNPGAGTPPLFSWEAWGQEPDPALLDRAGSVGHNPTATAFWLRAAGDRSDLAAHVAAARHYLSLAAAATGLDIPGVVPTAWPITRFEQAFSLHTLLMANLLHRPILDDVVQPQIDELAHAMQPAGLGFSDYYEPDGDDTCAAVAVLHASERPVNLATLKYFEENDRFLAYPGELQPSHSVTARGVHALSLFGEDVTQTKRFLLERQQPDGRWRSDKWNTSWVYTTCLATYALQIADDKNEDAINAAIDALLAYQHEDGSWGSNGEAIFTETAYGVLALQILAADKGREALRKGYQWLLRHYQPFGSNDEEIWLNKQTYRPDRIDRVMGLSAMLAAALDENEDEILQ